MLRRGVRKAAGMLQRRRAADRVAPRFWRLKSGHLINLLSTGEWAPMSNKTLSWTCLSTGLDTFECDWTVEK
jgi:hypothetical protein